MYKLKARGGSLAVLKVSQYHDQASCKGFSGISQGVSQSACTFYQDVFISVTTYKVCAVTKENRLPSNRKSQTQTLTD
jgi:hypothetical protein